MDLEHFLAWYFGHNTLLINLVIVAILVLVALTLFFSLFRGADAKNSVLTGNIDELEKTLRRVLDSAPLRPASEVAHAAGQIQDDDEVFGKSESAISNPEVQAVVEVLKKDVTEKEKVIKELQVNLQKLGQNTGLSDEQKKRIADLEKELGDTKVRLGEYEIIEDDIANLSLYKSENTKLKGELEKLRRGKSVKDDAASVPQVSEIVAEFAAIVGAEDNVPTPSNPGNAKVDPVAAADVVKAAAVESTAPAPVAAAPAAPAVTDEEDEAPLTVDPSKLIAEAAALPDAKDDDKPEEDQGDSGQKLISEFESFIKNG